MKKFILSTLTIALINGISAQTTVSSLEYVSTSRAATPKSSIKTPTQISSSTEDGKHTVQKGETLSSIARLYNTSYQQIALLNNLTSETIRVGQVLIVPVKESTSRGAGEKKPAASQGLLYAKKQMKHTVQAGDDIYSISDMYGIKIEDIRKLNNLGANVVNFNIGEQIIYKETYEPANAESVESRDLASTEVPTVEVEVESTPLDVTPPPATAPQTETPALAAPIPAATIVSAPTENPVSGERMESGGFIGIEDKTQQSPYYIYHKTLKYGTKVRLHIPDNAGYVEAIVVNRLSNQRKEIIGLSPACYRLIGGKAATNATITYFP